MNLTEAIIWGKIEGLSVIEIARAISWRAGTVHDLLKSYGIIGHAENEYKILELFVQPTISNDIIQALTKHKLTIEKWAKGWGFDLKDAIKQLSCSVDMQNPISTAIHRALNRDLPDEYFEIYHKKVTSFKSVAYARKFDRYSYIVDWDPDSNKYKSRIVGRGTDSDAPIGIDYQPERAVEALHKVLKRERQVESLQNAVAILAGSDCCQMVAQKTLVNP